MISSTFVVALPSVHKCCHCGGQFVPTRAKQTTCGIECETALDGLPFDDDLWNCFGCGELLNPKSNYNGDGSKYCRTCSGVAFTLPTASAEGWDA